MSQPAHILHILDHSAWQAAQASGQYRVESLETQGFIHFSTFAQMPRTAQKHYTGRADLSLLVIEAAKLGDALVYEPPIHPDGTRSTSTELFPHLYGALSLDAVRAVVPFPINPDGTFTLPAALAQYEG
jgi:uncharacterized protein (DUF952 family)